MAVFYNQATLSYNGNVTGSNITAGEIVATLSADKNAVSDTYTGTGDITYVISMVNSGDTDFTDLTVTDDLGRYTLPNSTTEVVPLTYVANTANYYVNGVKQPDPEVSAEEPLTFEGIRVPANGNAIVIYTARPNQFAPVGGTSSITNTATVTGGGLVNPVTAEETIAHSTDANLTISKSLDPLVVSENGTVTYTFTIQNYGSTAADANDNVIFRDTFDPVLNISSVTFNGAPWVSGTDYTYSITNGEFTSLDGRITVPAATFSQDETTGAWAVQPGTSTLVITGNISSSAD